MAVTVQDSPSIVLDSADRIVEVDAAAAPWLAPLVGEALFTRFRDAKPLFQPYFEQARRTGRVVEFPQFYDGAVTQVTVTPRRSRHLTVTWEIVEVLDTFTLEGLRSSLESILAKLDAAQSALERDRVRDTLRVVTGGA